MQILKIKTSRTVAGFAARLADDPQVKATSTSSEYQAAQNLAVRRFIGHNNLAQISEDELGRIVVTRTGGGTFRATYDK